MRTFRPLIMVPMVLMLCGCEGTAEMLGLGRNVPDEFSVVDRAPLSLPPDYSLRPPRPGAARPQEETSPERAKEALWGGDAVKSADQSNAERELLSATGAIKADPTIRESIDREARDKVTGSRNLVRELLWGNKDGDGATTVDAKAEAERLKAAKEKGEPATKTPTPVIEKSKSGWLF